MTLWQRLYITAAEPSHSAEPLNTLHQRIVEQLPAALQALDFKPYDPFGLIPSTRAYAQTVKLFIAPPDKNSRWLQIIAAPDSALPDELLHTLSQEQHLYLFVALDDEAAAQLTVYRNGEASSSWHDALQPYFASTNTTSESQTLHSAKPSPTAIPTEGMPDELRAMTDQLSGGLQNRQVQKLMNRMTNKLLNADQQQAGKNLLQGSQIDWTRPGGQQIAQLMDSLGIETWQSPEYTALRDAYQLQRRFQRNPDARLYPGDQEAMDAVPDAVHYTPIFAGRMLT